MISKSAWNWDEALTALSDVGFPCMVSPSSTRWGGKVVHDMKEFRTAVNTALKASPTNNIEISSLPDSDV